MKHTTGPWSVDAEKLMRQQISMGGIAIKAYSKRYDEDVALFNLKANEVFGGIEEAVANARLIAAAPEMLEALKSVADLHSQSRPDDIQEAIGAAIVAIEKATQS